MPSKFLIHNLRRAPGKRAPASADARDASLCSGSTSASTAFSHHVVGGHARRRAVTTRLPCSPGRAMTEANPSRRACVHGGNNPQPTNSQVQARSTFSHGRTYAAPSSPGLCCRPHGRLCDELCGPKQSPPPQTPSAAQGSPTCGRDSNPACPGRRPHFSSAGRQRPGPSSPSRCPSVIPQEAGAEVKGGASPPRLHRLAPSPPAALHSVGAWSSYLFNCFCLYLLLSFSLSLLPPRTPGAYHAVCYRTCCLFHLSSPHFLLRQLPAFKHLTSPLLLSTLLRWSVVSVLITSATLKLPGLSLFSFRRLPRSAAGVGRSSSRGLSLNRSQFGGCSTKYNTPAGT